MRARSVLALLSACGLATLLGSSPALTRAYCSPGTTCVTISGSRTLSPEEKAAQERREAEARAKAAAFKRKVDGVVATLGEHRRAEAENFVRMQEAAEAARPKRAPQQAAIPAATTPAAGPKGQNCKPTKTVWNGGGESRKSMAEARSRAEADRAGTCRDGKVCGPTTCTETKGFSQKLGKTELYAPGLFSCGFKVTHERMVCDTRVSAQ